MNSFVKRGRSILDSELRALDSELIQICQDVNMCLLKVKKCVQEFDREIVEEVISGDEDINSMCLALEKHSYKVIALQQPITADLRHVASIIRVIPDAERIGDHGKGIIKSLNRMDGLGEKDPVDMIYQAITILINRLNDAIECFMEKDSKKAIEISKGDDEIDLMTKTMMRAIIDEIKNDDIKVKNISELFFIAKSIERIGDYIVNICESIVFMNTGELMELE